MASVAAEYRGSMIRLTLRAIVCDLPDIWQALTLRNLPSEHIPLASSEAVRYVIAEDLLAQEVISLATAPTGYADSGNHKEYHYLRWRPYLLIFFAWMATAHVHPMYVDHIALCHSHLRYDQLTDPVRGMREKCYASKAPRKQAWHPYQTGSRAKQIPHQSYERQRHSCSREIDETIGASPYRQ